MSSEFLVPESGELPLAAAPPGNRRWAAAALDGFLLLLIAIGIAFRFSWVNWNQGTDLHPDEYGLTSTLTQLRVPGSLADYFNTRISTLSPYQKYDLNGVPLPPSYEYPVPDNRMRWGQWPITLIRWTAEATGQTGYTEMRLLGRRLSALADTLTLGLIFLIGRRLYSRSAFSSSADTAAGRRIGLLAAALSALSVMQIQQSHFMTADNFAVFFSTLAMYCAVRVATPSPSLPQPREARMGEGAGWGLLFGVAFGMAMASRINLLPLFGELVIALWIAYFSRGGLSSSTTPLEWRRRLGPASSVLGLAALAAVLTFRVTQPMSFRAEVGDTTLFTWRPNLEWVLSMGVAQAESSGIGGGPPGEQWTNRPALIFPFVNIVLWGMGLPLGLAAWAGLAWAAWRAVRGDAWRAHLLPITWAGGYFLFMGTRWVKSVRYFLPIYPFLCLLAAWAVWEVWRGYANLTPPPNPPGPPSLKGRGETLRSDIKSSPFPLGKSLPLALVTLGTLAWAWAFTGIYRTDNTRVQASRWIYQNVPSGSIIANESWDEALPLRVDGHDPYGGLYRGVTMEVRWPDDENKRQMFLSNLAIADVILLPSQRAIWSASRLPKTYPMTLEYYRALFDGRLGFEHVATLTTPLRLGPLFISDVAGAVAWGRPPELPLFNDNPFAAEEAFSVYDHAPVWIFRKRADFDLAQARAVLQSVDLSTVVVQGPREATRAPTLLMLPSDRLADQRAGGTWSRMFDRDGWLNRTPLAAVSVWWLSVMLLGWIAFPLTWLALPGLADRGYPLAKVVGLLVVAWLAWWLGSMDWLPYTRSTLVLCVAALAAVSLSVVLMNRQRLIEFVRTHWRGIVAVEAVALVLFVFDLAIRYGNGDLWHPVYGGEKPMDFAYLNAVLKSTSFPPYDPWLAGGYINYYYFGFVLVGVLIKLLAIVPSVAYNLILPTLFSCVGMGAFCVAYNLVSRRSRVEAPDPSAVADMANGVAVPGTASARPYLAGIVAALMMVVLGNLAQVAVLAIGLERAAQTPGLSSTFPGVTYLSRIVDGAYRLITSDQTIPLHAGAWYWDATRIIPPGEGEPGPITEFPFFTFLYADLHAHMIALPLTLLALAWALSVVLASTGSTPSSRGGVLATWALGALAIGALRPTNTWDFPTFLGLGMLAMAYATWRWRPIVDGRTLVVAGLRAALLAGLALALFWPFDQWYVAGYASAELWKGSKTPLAPYLAVHGLFLFLIATWLVRETWQALADTPASALAAAREWLGAAGFALIACLAFIALAWVAGYRPALIAAPLMLWAALLAFRPGLSESKRVVLVLTALGLLLTLMVEVIVLKGDVGRMNTVFKFYLQVWTLFSVSAAAALAWSWASLPAWRPGPRRVWRLALGGLLAAAALYPLLAIPAKVRDRYTSDAPLSLDGQEYMRYATYSDQGQTLLLADDLQAIAWMQSNVIGSPGIVEAQVPEYRWGSRFSIYTGLPTVLGWNWHQRQQRGAAVPSQDAEVWRRAGEIADFYSTVDTSRARDFLTRYDVKYVVIGGLERAYYSAEGLAKFQRMANSGVLEVVYSGPGTTIYEVVSRQ